jgi:hypothetical protein
MLSSLHAFWKSCVNLVTWSSSWGSSRRCALLRYSLYWMLGSSVAPAQPRSMERINMSAVDETPGPDRKVVHLSALAKPALRLRKPQRRFLECVPALRFGIPGQPFRAVENHVDIAACMATQMPTHAQQLGQCHGLHPLEPAAPCNPPQASR